MSRIVQRRDRDIYEITATARWDEKGEYLGHICVVKNISERKRAEEKLRESEERFRDLFENATDLIQIVSPEGRLLYVKPFMA